MSNSPRSHSPSRRLRPLGPFEIFSSSRHALGIYRRLGNTCRYWIPEQLRSTSGRGHGSSAFKAGPFTTRPNGRLRRIFRTALQAVIASQVSLSVGIGDEDTRTPYFTRVDSLDLDEHLTWTTAQDDGADLLRILEDLQCLVFPDVDTKPPWRVVVVENPEGRSLDVAFLVHHSLCDGRSAGRFHRFFLQALIDVDISSAQDDGEKENSHVVLSDQFQMVPSMEQMIKFQTSLGFLLKTVWRELGPKWLTGSGDSTRLPWTGKKVNTEPHRLHLRKIEISPDHTQHLIAKCRSEDATLTGLLHGLILLSLFQRLKAESPIGFLATTPISLLDLARKGSGIDLQNSFSVAVTGFNHTFDQQTIEQITKPQPQPNSNDKPPKETLFPNEATVWTIARRIRAELQDRVASLPRNDIISLLHWVGDWEKFWRSKFGRARATSWEVSNIGSIGLKKNDKPKTKKSVAVPDVDVGVDTWSIDRCIFSQPVMVTGAALCVNVASIEGGLLTVMLGWQEGVVLDELGAGVRDDLETWLAALSVCLG